MKSKVKVICFLFFVCLTSLFGYSQTNNDSVNNLIHLPNYKTSELNAIPQFEKYGTGKKKMILIPGIGFDTSVFKDFMEVNKKKYTMFAITIPGFGKTSAPEMPIEGTSYGEQTWNKSLISGIIKLMEKEKIKKPIIVGHFTLGSQIAMRLAIDYPDKVSGLIILGGQAKFIAMMKGEAKDLPLKYLIEGTDKYTAPKWFKPISKKDFDEGNYLPEIYSLDTTRGNQLSKQVTLVPLPVMIRYLLEYQASDLKAELSKIKCPTLILRAMFNKTILDDTVNNYVSPQFIETWNEANTINPLIKVIDVKESGSFVWKDQPIETYKQIENYTRSLN